MSNVEASVALNKPGKPCKIKTRYDGRVKKRQWEDKNNRNAEGDDSKRLCTEPFQRIKRRKVAMLMGYSGVNYYGMQRNPLVTSIEEELQKALLTTNYITSEAFDQIQTIQFQRAARTDKGVSAARQVVSLKMPDNVNIEEINNHLPQAIKVFAIKRVTKGFNSKSQCDSRTYTYMLPTFAFENQGVTIENHMDYRISSSIIERVNQVFKKYEGTHNFHNFTSKKNFLDPSARRYIMSIECCEPFIGEGMEFTIIKIKGQSFMLHQIRKMVGLGVAILRGLTDEDTLIKSFKAEKLDIPVAPGLGLVLEQVHYDRYNNRYGKDGFHNTLTWEDEASEVNTFKEKFINPTIINTEVNEKSMLNWLETLEIHSFDVREDKTPAEVEDDMSDSDDESSEPKLEIDLPNDYVEGVDKETK